MQNRKRKIVILIALPILIFCFLSVGLLTAQVDSTTLNDGLVGYWDFNEGSGSIANDLSSLSYDLTLSGGGWVTGKYDYGYKLNDTSYADMATTYTLSRSASSFSLWLFSDGNYQSNYGSTGIILGVNTDKYKSYFGLTNVGQTTSYAPYGETNNNGQFYAQTEYSVQKGIWVNVIVVFNSSSIAKVYTNGVLTYTSGALTYDLLFNRVGNITSDTLCSVVIDELRIYNRALSASEVTELYTLDATEPTPSPSPSPTPTPIATGIPINNIIRFTGESSAYTGILILGGLIVSLGIAVIYLRKRR